MRRLLFAAALAAATSIVCARSAQAAGFYVSDRGVRPLGRGGAFVAGADDLHSIWYNPAGLGYAEPGFLLDASFISFGNSYQRQAIASYNGNSSDVVNFDTVSASAAPLPIPTLVVAHNFGLRDWTFAAGVFAPNAVITSYPDTATAPQRYSLISLNGSLLAIAGLYAAYHPNDQISVGIGLQALFGSFVSKLALSGCPATLTCQPEDPDWDAIAQLNAGPIFAPNANAGVIWHPLRWLRFGLSGQLPVWIGAPATLDVRLPSASYFDGAMVSGNRAAVNFTLAPIVRAGVEVRPVPELRVEAAFVWEGWSMHDKISLTPVVDDAQPNGIQITNVRGVGTYDVGPQAIQRHFQDSYSVRLGIEYDQRLNQDFHVIPRVGASYETSATPLAYTSVLTFDSEKWMGSIGASVTFRRFRLDVVYAHLFASTVQLAPQDAMIYQLAPFRESNQAPMHAINGGQYTLAVDIIGLGINYSF